MFSIAAQSFSVTETRVLIYLTSLAFRRAERPLAPWLNRGAGRLVLGDCSR